MNTFYLQVYYHEQGSRIVDTVAFTVPDSITKQDFLLAVDDAVIRYARRGTDEDCDYLEVTDEMLTLIAEYLDGEWEYLDISWVVYVDGGGRELTKE